MMWVTVSNTITLWSYVEEVASREVDAAILVQTHIMR